jgi:hypothetical protein
MRHRGARTYFYVKEAESGEHSYRLKNPLSDLIFVSTEKDGSAAVRYDDLTEENNYTLWIKKTTGEPLRNDPF